MNADFSETTKDREMGFQIKIPKPCTQRKLISRICHAQSNGHKPLKHVGATICMLKKNLS